MSQFISDIMSTIRTQKAKENLDFLTGLPSRNKGEQAIAQLMKHHSGCLVFMDMDNKKDFSDRLTWLFGHARGSQVGDHRMFNDVNYYDKQEYFDQHPYVVIETPERKYYYEAMGLVIVPETTAFYRTSFTDDKDFTTQLKNIYESARTKNPNIKIKASDKYLVLSTCREEDDTIRSNLYLRQIPDSEMKDFLAKHGDQLNYVATRGQE